MKKLFLFLICLLVIFAAQAASAQDNEPVRKLYGDWDVLSNDTGWTVTAYRGTEKNVVIPNDFDNILVTQLAACHTISKQYRKAHLRDANHWRVLRSLLH